MPEQIIVREVAQSEATKGSRIAVKSARMAAKKRGYVYRGETFKFDVAGDRGVDRTDIRHGDVVFLSDKDVKMLRRIGRTFAASESKEEREEAGVTTADLVADVDTVERALVEDDYVAAAKLARLLKLDLPDKQKETVVNGLLEWLDTQRG